MWVGGLDTDEKRKENYTLKSSQKYERDEDKSKNAVHPSNLNPK